MARSIMNTNCKYLASCILIYLQPYIFCLATLYILNLQQFVNSIAIIVQPCIFTGGLIGSDCTLDVLSDSGSKMKK